MNFCLLYNLIKINMKSLVQFIREAQEASDSSKSFTFNFKDLENGKETIESLVDMANDKGIDVESTEDSITLKLTKEMCANERDKVDGIQDVLQQFSDKIRSDSKNASSESYAQFTKKFADTVSSMVSFIDSAGDEEEPEDGDKDKDDDKKNDEE